MGGGIIINSLNPLTTMRFAATFKKCHGKRTNDHFNYIIILCFCYLRIKRIKIRDFIQITFNYLYV